MHLTGVSMTNTQIRNGTVLRQGKVEFWDYAQQGAYVVVQPPFDLQPGDAFRTTCNYNAPNGTTWGIGTQNEMCIAFLFYYPRQLYAGNLPFICGIGTIIGTFEPDCLADYNVTPNFTNVAQLQRSFGTAPQTCPTANDPSSFSSSSSNQSHSTSAAAAANTAVTVYSSCVVSIPTLLALIGAVSLFLQ